MIDKNIYYHLGFSHFLGIGPVRFQALLKYFGNAKKAYEGKEQEITEVIGQGWATKFCRFRSQFDPVKKLEELKQKKIEILSFNNELYPKQLTEISDPPICLYVKGNIKLFFDSSTQFLSHENLPAKMRALESEKITFSSSINYSKLFFAIVGTRNPSVYGQQVAQKFSLELAQAGFIIVSGMAMGIDTIAHKNALKVGAKTIAVLGCGVDIIYPAVNRYLYNDIIEKGGMVISEFPPGKMVEKGLFIARNRIISGLSKGVLIVEGLKDSGALITARYAAEQGKEVFAPPAPITSPMSEAPNLLIKQGAKLVTCVEDIFEELGLKMMPKKKEEIETQLTLQEKIVFNLLHEESLTIDDIISKTQQQASEILNTISLLELKGVIEKNSEGKYQIKLQ